MPVDARTMIDNVRAKLPGEAKVLVVWLAPGDGALHCAQANVSQDDMRVIVESLRVNLLAEKLRP